MTVQNNIQKCHWKTITDMSLAEKSESGVNVGKPSHKILIRSNKTSCREDLSGLQTQVGDH